MHDVFEFGFRESLSIDSLVGFLSEYFGLDRKCIVSEDDYWSEIWEGRERVGVCVQTAADGLKTNLSGVSYRPLNDLALEHLGKAAARSLGSETVIGDFRKHGPMHGDDFFLTSPMAPFGKPWTIPAVQLAT
nr:hypothetical protein [Massilia sp. PDC64]